MILKKRSSRLLVEETPGIKGTQVKTITPTSVTNIFSPRNRRLAAIFREIESRIRERADPTYEDIEQFREIGGYFLIRRKESKYQLETIFETTGEVVRPVVFPGRGLDFRWDCDFPEISELNIDWRNAACFLRYHSHPFTTHPHPQDIIGGIKELQEVPRDIRYIQAIYCKTWTPSFLWFEHFR